MNEMRKLMEMIENSNPVDGETFHFGNVRITIWDTEVSINNGHGQNIWLTRNGWQDFVDGFIDYVQNQS